MRRPFRNRRYLVSFRVTGESEYMQGTKIANAQSDITSDNLSSGKHALWHGSEETNNPQYSEIVQSGNVFYLIVVGGSSGHRSLCRLDIQLRFSLSSSFELIYSSSIPAFEDREALHNPPILAIHQLSV